MKQINHYETLGVPRDATDADINRAYRKKTRQAHPDMGGSHEDMQAINAARAILLDPDLRAEHDEELAAGQASLEQLARECLVAHFKAAISSGLPLSFVAAVSRSIADAQRKTLSAKHLKQGQREYLLKRRRLVRTEGGAENLFQLLIDSEIAGLDAELVSIDRLLTIYPMASELLKSYADVEEETPTQAFDSGLQHLLRGLQGSGLLGGQTGGA